MLFFSLDLSVNLSINLICFIKRVIIITYKDSPGDTFLLSDSRHRYIPLYTMNNKCHYNSGILLIARFTFKPNDFK